MSPHFIEKLPIVLMSRIRGTEIFFDELNCICRAIRTVSNGRDVVDVTEDLARDAMKSSNTTIMKFHYRS